MPSTNPTKSPIGSEVSICIPAHNESACITNILKKTLAISCLNIKEILVCANGCTDDTAEKVTSFINRHPKVKLIEEKKASKIVAWNKLVQKSQSNIILFLDSDIQFSNDSISKLISVLDDKNIILATGTYTPQRSDIQFSRKLNGFIMLPLNQDFVYGGLYTIKKDLLVKHLSETGFNEMPKAFSEDIFLTVAIPRTKIKIVSEAQAFFVPPSKDELIKYFARGKAQLIDMEKRFPKLYERFKAERYWNKNPLVVFASKIFSMDKSNQLLKGTLSAIGKRIFHFLYKSEIDNLIQSLLNRETDSDDVMASLTRSESSRELLKLKHNSNKLN